MSYCTFVNNTLAETADALLHKQYHDHHYGFPIGDDDELFGRLLLEINQAGLSWTLMLRKQENFRKGYSNFSIDQVAAYGEEDIQRLLSDAGIIRNRLKINAAITNARRILELQKECGSFKELARCASSFVQRCMDQAIQKKLPFCRRRNRWGIFNEYRAP